MKAFAKTYCSLSRYARYVLFAIGIFPYQTNSDRKKASVCLFGGTRSMLKLVMFLLRCFYFRFLNMSVLVVVFPLLYQVLFIG